MIVYRNITTAFLENGGSVLLMKRGSHKKIAPGYWFGVGGHMEPEEINHPYWACLREIKEETGITKDEIDELDLKYIVFNREDDEVVINHIFFGKINTNHVVANDEGTLRWIPRNQLLDRQLTPVLHEILSYHYNNPSGEILLGIVNEEEPLIWWHPI